jgi:GTP pyrophosphokinase
MVMNDILRYIETHLEESLSNSDLAREAGYSTSNFIHRFKNEMNMTVQSYICRRRLLRACEEIIAGDKIIDIAIRYNWQTHSAFSKSFRREFGFAPSLLKMMQLEIANTGGSAMDSIFVKNMKVGTDKEILFEQLKKSVVDNKILIAEEDLIYYYQLSLEAYDGLNRYSGEEYVTHPLNVAIILAEIEATPELIMAGLFCDVQKKGDYSRICNKLDEDVKRIILKLDCDMNSEEVLVIKLAERLHNMRTIDYMDNIKRAEKAKETIDIYANCKKIGNQKLIDELHDLSIKYQ